MQSLVTLLGNFDLPGLRRKTILLVTPITMRLHRRYSASAPGLHLPVNYDKVRTILSRLDHNIRQNVISPP